MAYTLLYQSTYSFTNEEHCHLYRPETTVVLVKNLRITSDQTLEHIFSNSDHHHIAVSSPVVKKPLSHKRDVFYRNE